MFDIKSGERYEDRYGAWLEMFREMAEKPKDLEEVPMCWYPFVRYLGCEAKKLIRVFPEDRWAHPAIRDYVSVAISNGVLRTIVEMYSTLRPELADALYKSDVEWGVTMRLHLDQREFNVTNNGGFHRPEVLEFLAKMRNYKKPAQIKRAVLVPCAADKPYPAPLHNDIMSFLPDDTHLIVATGVLGLVPEDVWDQMPLYDSGIPNQWRLMKEVERFFTVQNYEQVIVYCDFYNEAIMRARHQTPMMFVNEMTEVYLNLRDPSRLDLLKLALGQPVRLPHNYPESVEMT